MKIMSLDDVLDCLHKDDRLWLQKQLRLGAKQGSSFEQQLEATTAEQEQLQTLAEDNSELCPWIEMLSVDRSVPESLRACIRKQVLSIVDKSSFK